MIIYIPLFVVIAIAFVVLLRSHIRAIEFNKTNPSLVIWKTHKDLWPYYILRLLFFLFLGIVIFSFLQTRGQLQAKSKIDNTNPAAEKVISDPRCSWETHWEGSWCVSNVRSIPVENGKWEEHWLWNDWSQGIITDCDSWYIIVAWVCLEIKKLPKELQEKINQTPVKDLPSNCERGKVDRIVDWDTIVVNWNKIRLIWIDTPESVDPNKPIEHYALEASRETENLLLGEKVCLSVDSQTQDRDLYNRYLRYVYLSDGTFVNPELIKWWYAKALTTFPFSFLQWFSQLESEAKQKKLWMRQ